MFFQVAYVGGEGDSVSLGSPWAGKQSSIKVSLAGTSPGELFVVVVKGSSNGHAVLRFDGDNGAAEVSMEAGDFRCPFALSPTDAESQFELTLPVDPSMFTVRAIEIWRVN